MNIDLDSHCNFYYSGEYCVTDGGHILNEDNYKHFVLINENDPYDELNKISIADGYGEVWMKDTKNFNNGFPILKDVPYRAGRSKPADGMDEEDSQVGKGNQVSHLFQDYRYKNAVTDTDFTIYANGATVTRDKVKKNYKSATMYTDILPSYIYAINKKGALVTATGRVIVGITSSPEKPTLVKGKIVDKEAAKVAAASIRNGQVTVTAKSLAGKVYLWVMDTGDAGVFTSCPVTVKVAPAALNTYAISDTDQDFVYGKTKKYTAAKLNVSEATDIYLYPTYAYAKKTYKAEGGTYLATVDAKSVDYFSVQQDEANPYHFIVKAIGGKVTTGRITLECKQNGRKIAFGVTAVNPVKKVRIGTKTNLAGNEEEMEIVRSKTAKVTGTFTAEPTPISGMADTTDVLRVYPMGAANGYNETKLAAGSIKITKGCNANQKKITAAVGKDNKTVTITAAKGVATGIKTYFLIVYNTTDTADGKGYMVVSVTTK